MTHAILHVLEGQPEPVCDPLTGRPLSFEEADLGAAVAQLLADGGYVACALAPAPPDAQIVGSEDEALAIVRLLVAGLRFSRSCIGASAARN